MPPVIKPYLYKKPDVTKVGFKVVRIAHLVIAEGDRTLQRYYPLKAMQFRLSLGQPLPISTGTYSALMPERETMAVLETKRAFTLLLNPRLS
jgi:hypothetical protein